MNKYLSKIVPALMLAFSISLISIVTMKPAVSQLVYGLAINGGGIVGTKTNDDAPAGNVGEFKTSTIAVANTIAGATTTNSKNITSLSLTAGDWDLRGMCDFAISGVTATVQNCGYGTTTDTLAGQAGGSGLGTDPVRIVSSTNGTTLTGTIALDAPVTRFSTASTATVYLVGGMTYSAGSFTQHGTLSARRVR